MKIIGILADNYKLKDFRRELNKEGYKDRKEVVNVHPGVTAIKISVPDIDYISSVKKIEQVCKRLNLLARKYN